MAVPIARLLHAPLDVLLVRKLGIPGQPELAAGAIACGGVRSLNPGLADHLDPRELARIEQHEGLELIRRERAYRDGRKPVVLSGKRVILVDDGAATGASMSCSLYTSDLSYEQKWLCSRWSTLLEKIEEIRN